MTYERKRKADLLEEVGSLETRIRELEERLEHLSAATTEGVFLHDAGTVLEGNRAGAAMFGYEPRELVGRNVLDLTSPESRPRALSGMAWGTDQPYELAGKKKDGTSFPIEIQARSLALGDKTVRAVTVRDLTSRRAAELELRDSRERYRSILQNLRGIAYRVTAGGFQPLFLGGSVFEITGRRSEEILGGALRWREIVHPDDRERVGFEKAGLSEGTASAIDTTYRIVRPGGAVRWVRDIARTASLDSEIVVEGLVVDVTAEKETEEELLRTRDLLSRAEELAGIGSWSWDVGTNHVSWSPGMYRHYGTTPEKVKSPLELSTRSIHPEDMNRLREHMRRAGEIGKLEPIEYRIRLGETVRYHRTEGEVQRDPETGSVRMLGFVQDVTVLKQAEEERERAEQERERLFDLSIDLLSVAGFDGFFKQLNPAWTRTLGFPLDELLSRPWLELVHPDDRAATVAADARLRRGDLLTGFENRYQHRDGSFRWFSWNARALPEASLIFAVTRDVTDRRRAEEALRESEERYRSLFEGAPYGIFRSTPDGALVAVNRALAEMLGYSAEELQEKSVCDVYQDPLEWTRLAGEALDRKQVRSLEAAWRRKDGTPTTVRISGRPLYGDDEVLLGFEMVAEDVTERRSLEEQFRQAQKMEAVGRLAGGIAHDFNNLLTAITGYADLLHVRIPPDDPKSAYVGEIGAAADRASALTRQLLAFSRRQLLQPRVVNLEEIVQNVERMLGRIIGEDIELETRLEARGRVRADASQLEQVLVNLAVNARDAMPHGGKLRIETRDAELEDALELNRRKREPMPPGSYVLLEVSDTGVGIDRESLSHIFEPFFTTKGPGKGTGLGLATVYGIVKQSEGFIWVSSEPGRGARFEIYLPRVAAEADTSGTEAPPEIASGSETILLVEDEDGVRRIVSEMLSWHGYTVVQAKGPAEAVEVARTYRGPIHLLLTDVVMPRLGGRALREQIEPYRRRIPVLYISGYAGEERTEELLQDGAAFLPKPFTAAALAGKVRQVLTASELTPGPV